VTGKRLLYAPNVHQGGGRTLLLPLLEALKDDVDVTFVLDARMPLPTGVRLAGHVCRVEATLFSRLWFEWRLRSLIKPGTLLLCMGNLPPLFAHQGLQQVFVQNRYLVDDVSLKSLPLPVRVRLMVERWWLRSRSIHVKRFIVQTPTMQRLLGEKLGKGAEIIPFVAAIDIAESEGVCDKKMHHDFLYVASGEPHKGHEILLEAWIIMAESGLFPSLCLTLDEKRFPELCTLISGAVKKHALNIFMMGECSHADVQLLYRHSSAMIYPSQFESFGLPLIEAAIAGLPVLASNASYVTDVIEPSAVFDAASAQSIASAVQSFRTKPALLNIQLLDANEFLTRTFSKELVV